MLKKVEKNILEQAIETSKNAFIYTLIFSFVCNLLMLMLPIYTLQVLDRVVSSGSIETLVMLSLVALAVFACLGLLQTVRSFVFIKIGEWVEHRLAPEFLRHSISSSAVANVSAGSQSLRDLSTVKGFITGPGINTLFDLPWSIIYIAVIYLIHPLNGFIALSGSLVLFAIAIFNEYATKEPLDEANERSIKTMNQVDLATRNAEVIEAMGMMKPIVASWHRLNDEMVKLQSLASNRAAIINGISKTIRLVLQIAIVGVGGYLVLQNELTVGSIIACSILTGRALAPFEAAITIWKSVISARKSYRRLQLSLEKPLGVRGETSLPVPQGKVDVEKVIFSPMGSMKPVLKGISFGIEAGEVLGVMGPSAAGKTTLAKLLVGVWKPNSGSVRIDAADVYIWNREDFGRHVGYLPQDVELFNGTIKENIARMNPEASDEEVVAAAQMANAHEMILKLPNGYDTEIGVGGALLSAGQRQRVGLARAFFGTPRFIVLDEPNANLDREGEVALAKAIANAKAQKMTVIVITHRPALLSAVDKILILQDGMVSAFGPQQEVLQKIMPQQPAQTSPAGAPSAPPSAPKPGGSGGEQEA